MPTAEPQAIIEKLDALRVDLVDMAFALECRGRIDAADVAITASVRVGELCEELALTVPVPVEAGESVPGAMSTRYSLLHPSVSPTSSP